MKLTLNSGGFDMYSEVKENERNEFGICIFGEEQDDDPRGTLALDGGCTGGCGDGGCSGGGGTGGTGSGCAT